MVEIIQGGALQRKAGGNGTLLFVVDPGTVRKLHPDGLHPRK